jgi:hypothetical protein
MPQGDLTDLVLGHVMAAKINRPRIMVPLNPDPRPTRFLA